MIPDCNPIQQIVTILGSFDLWPSFILKLLFVDEYSILNEFIKLNFLYGNSVPLDLALSVFTMFHDQNYLLSRGHFYVFYTLQNMGLSTGCVCQTCAYYDLEEKKLKWINRENPNYEQREILLGIENTGHVEVIREKIRMISN
jgi:hypothetical protein